jgi:hypothetical protein
MWAQLMALPLQQMLQLPPRRSDPANTTGPSSEASCFLNIVTNMATPAAAQQVHATKGCVCTEKG